VKNNVSSCGPLGNISITALGGTGTKTYSDNNGTSYQGSSLFSNLNIGTYTIKVKDGNNCYSSPTALVVSTNAGVTFTSTVVNATACGIANGKITVNGAGGSGFFNYSDNGGTTYVTTAAFTSLVHGGYPIKVKDGNGCFSSTVTVNVGPTCGTRLDNNSVLSDSNSNSFNIFPNPARNEATVIFSTDKEENYLLLMTDVTGRIILSQNKISVAGENQYQLDLTEVEKGIYIISLQNEEGIMQKRLVVE
jgi:hypothetical protein